MINLESISIPVPYKYLFIPRCLLLHLFLFVFGHRLCDDVDGVEAALELVVEQGVDHPVPLDGELALERVRYDQHPTSL